MAGMPLASYHSWAYGTVSARSQHESMRRNPGPAVPCRNSRLNWRNDLRLVAES